MRVKTLKEAEERYGKIDLGVHWRDEEHHMTVFRVPEIIAEKMINSATGKPTNKIYCNEDLKPALMEAFMNLLATGCYTELKSFDGCFQIRKTRGTNSLSTHSYGLAIDINAAENPLGAKPVLSANFVECFKMAGFTWGGDFQRLDGMHFSYAWE